MNQQQNKHSSKNKKRNFIPAKVISNEYAIINNDGILLANFKTIEEVIQFKHDKGIKATVYNIKVYKLNNKTITTKQKED